MRDQFGREITYLRLSVTDRCNLRCRYCMPPEGVPRLAHGQVMRLEELAEVAAAAAELGVRKIRLTGGEPLVRRGVEELVAMLAAIPGVEDLAMTTNGTLLAPAAAALRAAGLRRVNLSLDTLDPEKYARITRGGRLADALAGLEAALAEGLAPVKVNTVLMGGFNDDEIPALAALTRDRPIHLRFIELMPMARTEPFPPGAYLSGAAVLERLEELEPAGEDGVAQRYRFPGAAGTVGLIRPMSCRFCGRCSRLRLTADGFLKPCLHSAVEVPVRGLHGAALREAILRAAALKPPRYGALSPEHPSEAGRDMNGMGG